MPGRRFCRRCRWHQASLTDGRASWAKLQSVFGVVRMIGGSEALAWTLQVILMGAIAVLMAAIWRSKVSFEIKAATLVTGALLCTPYLFMYDLVALAVPMAFLLRASREADDGAIEMTGFAVASRPRSFRWWRRRSDSQPRTRVAGLTARRALIYFLACRPRRQPRCVAERALKVSRRGSGFAASAPRRRCIRCVRPGSGCGSGGPATSDRRARRPGRFARNPRDRGV